MSRPGVGERRKFAHLSRMAWASLSLAMVAALGGLHCLVTADPDFAKPVRTAPFVTSPVPSPFAIQRRSNIPGLPGVYASETISFEIVSEDLQSRPQALLLLDFQGFPYAKVPLAVKADIPAGHLDGVAREAVKMDMKFGPDVQPGCHTVTAVVSHEFTLTFEPKVKGDVSTVTWWYELVDSDANPNAPSTCILQAAPSADAGADAMDARAQ